ncbi:MAG: hypothetical protein QM778_25645 [Myxococcales bacterium]
MGERERDSDDSGAGVKRAGTPVDPLRIWNALRARWTWIFVAGVIGAFVGAAVAKKMISQTFAAQAVVAYQGDVSPQSPERQTVFESLTLNSILAETAKRMKLPLPPATMRSFITLTTNERTNIVTIDGNWATADGAAGLVNTLVDVFLESRQRIMRERLELEAQRLRGAVGQAEAKYSDASKAYDKFRREQGITDISQERELAITQAAELAAQADTARADEQAARSKLDGIKLVPSTAPAPTTTSEADARQADLDEKRLLEARRELDVAKIQYSEDHPTVRRLAAEVSTLDARVKNRYGDKDGLSARRHAAAERQASSAANRQRVAEEYRARLKDRLNKLSAVEGQAAVLLGELKVAEESLERAKQMLSGVELQLSRPSAEFQVLERAVVPQYALSSSRRRAALGFPLGFALLATLITIALAFRKLDVRTPSEAAYWSKLPVIGASTWPRDPEMLSSLMHDLDDYAPHCEGVTLIVGVSIEEAHLARRVAEWDGHRMPKIHDVNRLLAAGAPLAVAEDRASDGGMPEQEMGPPVMQILTLTGPVPAQALRRAARLADRVLVVVYSGKHDIFQLMKIRGRLGRDTGIGLLFVGLEKDYAMVRDRVGAIESFWYATRSAVSGRAEA